MLSCIIQIILYKCELLVSKQGIVLGVYIIMELTNVLLNHLQPYFEHKRYEQGYQGIDFLRQTSFGHSSIHLNKTQYEDGLMVSFFIGIRISLLETSLNTLLGQNNIRYDGITSLMVNANSIAKNSIKLKDKYFCITPSDVRKAADAFIDFMDREGFDFLNNYKTINKIDSLYNDFPEKSAQWCNHSYIRCFRAMTSAKILGRQDYEVLLDMHEQYLAERGYKGQILEKFKSTFALLNRISLN